MYVDFWFQEDKLGGKSLIKNYQPSNRNFELDKGRYEINVEMKVNFCRRAYYDPEKPTEGIFTLGELYNSQKPMMFAMVGWHGLNRPKLVNKNASKNPSPVPGYEDKVCSYLQKGKKHDLELNATYQIDHDGNGWKLAFSFLDGCYKLLSNNELIGTTFNILAKDFRYSNGDDRIELIEPSSFLISLTKIA